MEMRLRQIGTIHTPFKAASGTPIQPPMAGKFEGVIELLPDYEPATADLAGFDRIWMLYWFDRAADPQMKVRPYMDTEARGLFATRAPSRPNPIGISAVRLISIDGVRITIGEADVLDGTPLLDIKPYVPRFDSYPAARAGWLDLPEAKKRKGVVADDRFEMQG